MAVAADNSTVKITIDVVDANSGEVVSRVTKNLSGLATAGKTAASGLKEAGAAGEEAGAKISKGMGDAGAHTLTNLDKVRLLRDDLGIRIPRAMENVIARSSAASAAIGAIGSGLVVLGAAEIFIRMGVAAYEFYKRVTDVTEAVQKYAVAAMQASQQKLFDTASMETARSLVQQTGAEIDRLDKKRETAGVGKDGSGSAMQYLGYGYIKDFSAYTAQDSKDYATAQAQRDAANDRLKMTEQQSQMDALQAAGAAKSARLVGDAARQAKQDTADAIATLKLQQTQTNEQFLYHDSLAKRNEAIAAGKDQKDIPKVYQPSSDAGLAEYGDTVASNHENTASERAAEARKQSEETLHIQADARAAGLQGEALYMAQRDEHLRQLKEKMQDTELSPLEYMKRVAAADQQYSAERLKRLETEHAETARMQAEAAAGGQRGMAAIDAHTNTDIASVEKAAPGFSDPATKAAREAAIRAKSNTEMLEAQQQFNERLAQMSEGHANSSLSANARIEVETKRTISEIEKAWRDEYGQLSALDQRRVQSRQAVDAAIAKIEVDAARQRLQARQTVVDETEKMEAEAGRRGLSREQEERAAIIDEYNQRFQHLEELRVKDADNADLYRRQEIAAEEIKNGKILEADRAMRDKLAGTIRGFMTNPVEAAKRLGEDAASKTAANFVMKATGHPTGDAGSSAGGVFDGVFGHSSRKSNTASQTSPVATPHIAASSTTLSATNATITVQNATLTGFGGGSAGSTSSFGAVAGGSSTTTATDSFSRSPFASSSTTGNSGASIAASSTTALTRVPTLIPRGAASSSSAIPSFSGGGSSDESDFGSSIPLASGGGGITSTGGPAVAASRMALGGGGDAGAPGAATINGLSTGMADAQGLTSLGKQLFGPGGPNASAIANGTSSVSKSLSAAGPAISGAAGMFSAVEGNGGVGGALTGAMAGAQLGSYFGPMGTAIGAGAGAIIGFIGFGGASAADDYYTKQVKPHIDQDVMQFSMGQMDYQSASDDLIKLEAQARQDTKKFGMGGKRVWDDHIHPDIMSAIKNLDREQKAGRTQYSMSAAQFHNGGLINDFGSMSTTGNQGWVHAQQGEYVMRQQVVPSHYQGLQMIQSGASHSDMANYYGGGSGATTLKPAASSSKVNLHFHSPDPEAALSLFMDNKHHIRTALNASYAENSGVSD